MALFGWMGGEAVGWILKVGYFPLARCHSRLIDGGWRYFNSMIKDYGLSLLHNYSNMELRMHQFQKLKLLYITCRSIFTIINCTISYGLGDAFRYAQITIDSNILTEWTCNFLLAFGTMGGGINFLTFLAPTRYRCHTNSVNFPVFVFPSNVIAGIHATQNASQNRSKFSILPRSN